MKNNTKIVFLFALSFCLIVSNTCKKLEKSMLVSTGEVRGIETNYAEASGMVVDPGEEAIQHGHCYGTSSNVSVAGTRTQLGKPSAGGFTSQLTDLTAGTKYYVKAYISSGSETVYGKDEISFSTAAASLPVLTTAAVTAVTFTTATSGGEVTGDGGAPVTARGVCFSTSSGPITDDGKTSDNSGTGVFTSNLTGLTPNTTYFVRAYATNTAGTGYGEELSFKTIAATPPALSTAAVTDITQNEAISGGNITGDGGVPVTLRGVCWNTTVNPTTAESKTEDGEGTGSFVSSLTGLTGNTTYYVRSYATNSAGTSYGDEISFKTGAVLPALTTTAVTSVTSTSAVSGGDVTDDGGSPVTARGVCWSTSPLPAIEDNTTSNGTGTGSFASNITGLTANTRYYVRAYATNSAGTAYGNDLVFTTGATSTLPGAPTIGTATAGNAQATVTFTAPSSDGGFSITGYTVTSSPGGFTGTGSASPVTVTGLTNGTAYTFTVTATNVNGTSAESAASNSVIPLPPGTVFSPATGRIWMDRNLGASQVATSSTDALSYGDLYQWGRLSDGHQIRTWGTTLTLSSTDIPGHGNFILAPNSPYDWRSPQNDNLWQGVSGTNNPCPGGYRLPTDIEWDSERLSWSTNDAAGAFASPLKLSAAGTRLYSNGSLNDVGSEGGYWSSSAAGTLFLSFGSSGAYIGSDYRAYGFSVRCIKD